MKLFMSLAFLFFIGSVTGWILEVFYDRFLSRENTERKWINPGFCTGPYVPIYGFGLCTLYLIAGTEERMIVPDPVWNKILLFVIMAVCMTLIEYVAGVLCIRLLKVRLWDYSKEWGNIQGIICPKFSLMWAVLGAIYYFLVHPHILGAVRWLSENLAFSFVVGLFFGVFLVDVVHSAGLVVKLRRFAKENGVIVRFEAVKQEIRRRTDETLQKFRFMFPFRSDIPLSEHLKKMRETFENIKTRPKKNKGK